ncbi:MAG: trypsin-like peptidase domain-containing protein [Saprospirales bacterium]|nr:trypsin-like peptidase domain-containing protein [Saprospirales bacterium]MBK8491505.1 trypsin-like peptidase domain-containing protein [Saprospirales bacterium]
MKRFWLIIGLSVVFSASISTSLSYYLFRNWWIQEVESLAQPGESHSYRPVLTDAEELWGAPDDFVAISERVTGSVVNVQVFDGPSPLGGGSGVILSSDGYIATNYHVVEGASRIQVTLSDKRELAGKVVGTDPTTDLALLKVRATGLHAVSFANSDEVRIGEWALAIGNPFNLTSTVTAGIVSAKARNINILPGTYSIESFIQTDAAVNPGNSGGALVNDRGALIGINSAIMSEGGTYEGYSFAIPSNLVSKVMSDLKEYGKVQRALLGVNIAEVNEFVARDLNLPLIAGVLVRSVTPGGSAEEAGLKAGDVILKVNGIDTNSVPELQEQVARFRPGDAITLEYVREGRKYTKEDILLKGLK